MSWRLILVIAVLAWTWNWIPWIVAGICIIYLAGVAESIIRA